MARLWRVHHPLASPETTEVVELSAEESHHVHRVLRLRAGDPLRVFDGCGREWEATLVECGPKSVSARLGAELSDPVEPALDVVLFQGLCRPERMEWVIQKATECGCGAIRPLQAARGSGPRLTGRRLSRWRRVALEACKQSGRRRLPLIEPADSLPAPAADVLALLLHPGPESSPLAGAIAGVRPRAVWLAVGPESGFAEAEIQTFRAAGWRETGLGPRVLRTETAGIAAAAILLHRWADLGRGGDVDSPPASS